MERVEDSGRGRVRPRERDDERIDARGRNVDSVDEGRYGRQRVWEDDRAGRRIGSEEDDRAGRRIGSEEDGRAGRRIGSEEDGRPGRRESSEEGDRYGRRLAVGDVNGRYEGRGSGEAAGNRNPRGDNLKDEGEEAKGVANAGDGDVRGNVENEGRVGRNEGDGVELGNDRRRHDDRVGGSEDRVGRRYGADVGEGALEDGLRGV
jgi:hypothetical protein